MPDYTKELVGRHYVTSSGNICKVVRLGENAIRFHYKDKPTDNDMEEVKSWMLSIIGTDNLNLTECKDINKESEMLSEWKKNSNK